jgi:hypothetical protein
MICSTVVSKVFSKLNYCVLKELNTICYCKNTLLLRRSIAWVYISSYYPLYDSDSVYYLTNILDGIPEQVI